MQPDEELLDKLLAKEKLKKNHYLPKKVGGVRCEWVFVCWQALGRGKGKENKWVLEKRQMAVAVGVGVMKKRMAVEVVVEKMVVKKTKQS